MVDLGKYVEQDNRAIDNWRREIKERKGVINRLGKRIIKERRNKKWLNMWIIGGIFGTILNLFIITLLLYGFVLVR